MSNSLNENVIELSISCNIEDAVAKMLGWLQGPVCHDLKEPDEGYTLQQLKYMDSLIYTLNEHLTDLRNAALSDASYIYENTKPEDRTEDIFDEVLNIEDLSKRARLFLIDIQDELSNGELSVIKIDKTATEKHQETFITLKSLDRWAKRTHDISILEYLDACTLNNQEVNEALTKAINTTTKKDIFLQRRQETAIIEVIKSLVINPLNLPKIDKGKRGTKSKVKNILKDDPLFKGSTVFKKAWERLLDFGEIAYEDNPTPK